MFGTNSFKTLLAAGALVLAAGGAGAATTTLCPGSSNVGDREFTLTTQDPVGNTCFASGSPNDNNDSAFQAMLAALVPAATFLGKIEFDKTEGGPDVLVKSGPEVDRLAGMIDLLTRTGGRFTLDLTGIVNAVLVFKVGNNPGPAYAAFRVDSGLVEGSWSNAPTEGGGLSHVTLYGALAPVPVPAAGFLLIGALGGLVALRRRRHAA